MTEQPEITPEDLDAGVKEVALDYRPGKRTEDMPAKIALRAITLRQKGRAAERIAAREKAGDEVTNWDYNLETLIGCLPMPWNKEEFLDRLTPECGVRLVNIALLLSYGPAPKKNEPAGEAP